MGKRGGRNYRGRRNAGKHDISSTERKHLKKFGEQHPIDSDTRDKERNYSKVAEETVEFESSSSESENEETPLQGLLRLVGNGIGERVGEESSSGEENEVWSDTGSLSSAQDEASSSKPRKRKRAKDSTDGLSDEQEKNTGNKKPKKVALKKSTTKSTPVLVHADITLATTDDEQDVRKDVKSKKAKGKRKPTANKKEEKKENENEEDVEVEEEKEDEERSKPEGEMEVGDKDQAEMKDDDDEVLEEDEEEKDKGDEEEVLLKENDPFSIHFERDLSEKEVEQLSATEKWKSKPFKMKSVGEGVFRWKEDSLVSSHDTAKEKEDLKKLGVKSKLAEQVSSTNVKQCGIPSSRLKAGTLTSLQHGLFEIINKYQDLLFPREDLERLDEIRLVYCLHILNHVLKTRSRVVAHNTKLKNTADSTHLEYRDQGLTRPKVLVVLPTRHAAFRVVTLIISLLSSAEQCMVSNQKRLASEFGDEGKDDAKKGLKPEDFDILFAGNTDEDFRLGLSVSKKSLRLYSPFYMSDIIIASPLGLRRVIKEEGDRDGDYDFLSSIEILVMDQTEFFFMQNWSHVVHFLKHLHLQPKESHGVDFARARMWMLNGWARHYRQTILLSGMLLPGILAVSNKFCHNYAGKVQVHQKKSEGMFGRIALQLQHTFLRFDCEKQEDLRTARFDFFLAQVLPDFKDKGMKQTMIFIPDYFDYCRIRNHFHKEAISFAHIDEYAEPHHMRTARRNFKKRRVHFLLYTERIHFYRRFKLRGPKHLIFYELPQNPHFYSELCNLLECRLGSQPKVTVLWSRFESLKLRAVLGHTYASRMFGDKGVHMILSGVV